MDQWEAIVVAVDFSEPSKAALREAARLASWHRCPLHIAHVIALNKEYADSSESSMAISLIRDQVEQKIKLIALEEIEFCLQINYHIMVGHAFREICQLLEDIQADILIMGSYGSSNIPNRLGMIATKCARKAPVPVLLVRKDHDDPFHHVAVAVDFSKNSQFTENHAAEIAFENQSILHLIHNYRPVWNVPDYAFCDLSSYMETPLYRKETDALKQKLENHKQSIQDLYKDLVIKTALLEELSTPDAICQYVRENQVDLVVLGTRGRTGIKNLLLGTTAERLIQECPCSALVIKSESFVPSAV